MLRIFAVLGLMASLAVGLTSAQAAQKLSATCPVVTDFNSATINCRTSRKAPLMYNLGGQLFHVGSGSNHDFTAVPLPAATNLAYTPMALISGKWRSLRGGSFTTQNPLLTSSGVDSSNVLLGGKPTFLFFEDGEGCIIQPERMQVWQDMGDTTLAGYGWTCDSRNHQHAADRIQTACANKCWWLEQDTQNSQDVNPAVRLNIDGSVDFGPLDYQPAFSFCGSQTSNNIHQYQALRQEVLHSNKPVLAVNHLVKGTAPASVLCVTPQRLTANLWTEACAGVKGFGYKSLGHDGSELIFPPKDVKAAANRFKNRFAAREPVMLAPSVSVKSKSSKLVTCAHRYRGVTTVFTINESAKPLKTSFKVAGAANKSAWRTNEYNGAMAKIKAVRGSLSGNWTANAVLSFQLP